MLNLDFHFPQFSPDKPPNDLKVPVTSGYGLAYRDMLHGLQHELPDFEHIRLTQPYAGGDVQIYFGSLWDKQSEHFERKSDIFGVYTMFEYDVLPDEWIKHFERFDFLIVPSEYCKYIFEKNGFDKPIYVIHLGVNPERWKFMHRERNKKDPFTYLWQGTFLGDRKGSEIVEVAFKELKLPDTQLIFKTNPRYCLTRTELDLKKPKFRYIHKVYDDNQLKQLIHDVDCSVYPSTGEGLGLIPLEHMASGLPVILGNNTGMSDFCDPLYNMPVQCTEITSYYGKQCGVGYMPDKEQVKAYMLWAYDNQADARILGREASDYIRREWSTYKFARKLLHLVEEEIVNVKMG